MQRYVIIMCVLVFAVVCPRFGTTVSRYCLSEEWINYSWCYH